MAAPAKPTPFALRDLPPPEEWHKRKVALISGASTSTRFSNKLRHLMFPSAQVSLAKMGPICEYCEWLV